MIAHQLPGGLLLYCRWLALEGHLKCTPHLDLRFHSGLLPYPFREKLRLLQQKRAIQQVQRLQRRSRAVSARSDLPGVGAVEDPESVVQLHPRLGPVDHTAKLGRSELTF